jgi:hypothetical protein
MEAASSAAMSTGIFPWRYARHGGVTALGSSLPQSIELVLISLIGLFIARPWLDMDPWKVPLGPEYNGSIQINYLWTLLLQCGGCAFWYGSVAGGYPAFVDPNGSQLHPVVAATTLLWGVINGGKVALVAALMLVGLAQWWLGRELGLSRLARLWSAAMALVAAHVVARMHLGMFGFVISAAAASLVLPAILALVQRCSVRWAAILGVLFGQLVVGGNGYLQLAFILSLPAVVFLLPAERSRLTPLVKRFRLAVLLSLLIAAPLLLPFAHFLPEFSKDNDPAFRSAQSLGHTALNLVIADHPFYHNESLGKLPYPSHHVNFIGWVPVGLAVFGLFRHTASQRRPMLFLAAFAFLALWASSAGPQSLLVRLIPIPELIRFISGARYTSFMATLAVPAILGLAGIGLDQLLKSKWPAVRITVATQGGTPARTLGADTRWLLAIPLLFAIHDARVFSGQWIASVPLAPEMAPVMDALETPDAQWVNVPNGPWWIAPAVVNGFKIADSTYLTWHWREHPNPRSVLEARREGVPDGMRLQSAVANIPIYFAEGRDYATLTLADGTASKCTARAVGGDIDVACNAATDGVLTVLENSWPGWHAHVDGQPTVLRSARWLTLDLPAGNHTVALRYRPWDAILGLLLAAAGLAVAGYCVWKGGHCDLGPVQPNKPEGG